MYFFTCALEFTGIHLISEWDERKISNCRFILENNYYARVPARIFNESHHERHATRKHVIDLTPKFALPGSVSYNKNRLVINEVIEVSVLEQVGLKD